ncbi:M48 family metallopeptidase [Streptomyces sp. NPDC093261]|uniref:M48 family metallopeptidase n=1 Tax=Streptomyces sp. NPDC093261 TaxID=3366037 RepID=UPI0037FB1323
MSLPVQQAIAALPLPAAWRWRVDVRPRRTTLGIEVTPDGHVLFSVPADADPADVASAVRRRLPRLAEEIRRRGERPPEPVKELISGSSFAYLGRRYRLRLVAPAAGRKVRLHQGWLELPRCASADEGARRIAAWYIEKGSAWTRAHLPSLQSRVGVVAKAVDVADLPDHWGSCGPDGVITLHWAVMQLPSQLLDFVITHELCHLKVPGHGPRFRREMRLALPDADRRESWFAVEEPMMWRGLVRPCASR